MTLPKTALLFLASQALILPAIIGLPYWRSTATTPTPTLPEFRSEPVLVTPLYNDERVITDQQLADVLHKLRPQLAGEKPKINYVDHALRFWGIDAEFGDKQCISGMQMREILTDHRAFSAVWKEGKPLLIVNDKGVAVRVQEGSETSSHVDHTMATLAEVGTPLNHPIVTSEGEATYEGLLKQALLDFRLNQQEYEWTALALALYAPTTKSWVTREGQEVSFDRLADRILREPLNKGVCFGNHRLYALAIMLRVDEQETIFSPETRQQVIDHLQQITARLVKQQHKDGWWDSNWPDGQPITGEQKMDDKARRLLATGHALEWWAMAPQELHPPRETLARAGQWLVTEIEQMDAERVQKDYTFLTHVGRALAIWRGKEPAEFLPLTPSTENR